MESRNGDTPRINTLASGSNRFTLASGRVDLGGCPPRSTRPEWLSGVNPAELRTVKLSPARLIRLFRTACRVVRSSGSVSVCQRTHTARRLRGLSKARAFTSYRIGKDHPHDPDILSLRHDCPTLAAVSGKWFPLDGRSAIATGWFPSLSDRVRGPSHPPGGCSVTRPPTCRVTRPRAWFQASILNRFASSLAGG